MKKTSCQNLVAMTTSKSMNTNDHIKLVSVKFLKTNLSFMEFAQILKKFCWFKVAVDGIPATNLHTVNLNYIRLILIYPYLTYCTTVWSSTYITNLNRIFLLQKRAVRAMTNSNHLAPFFAQLNILDIFKVNSLYIAKFMFSSHQRLLPSPFLNLFPTGGQIHNTPIRRKTGSCMRARPKGRRTRESQINKHGRKSFTRDRLKPYVRRHPMLIC